MKKSLWIRIPALIISVIMLLGTVGCDILLEDVIATPPTDTAGTQITDTNVPPEGNDSVSPSDTHTEMATQSPADTHTEMATQSPANTDGPENLTGISPKNYDCNFTILNGNCNVIPSDHIFSEEQDGPVLTATYERALRIREHLGVQLTCNSIDDIIGYAQQVIANGQAGVDDYQLVITHPSVGLTELITSDLLYDIAALESVNLNQPYWATDMMDEIRIHGRYLLGYQDLCLMASDLVVFDKTLLNNYGFASPYEEVLNGSWTLELCMDMSRAVYQDNDGDGIPSEYDIFGTCIWSRESLNSFIPASDIKIISLDGDDIYSVKDLQNNEKLFMLVDRIFDLYNCIDVTAYDSATGAAPKFPNATSLFYFCNTRNLNSFMNREGNFGILPYPKFDLDQADYRSRSQNGFLCVPQSIANPDMVGDVLELLGYYSSDVKDAYCAQLLKAYDSEDDARMLDIIWKTQVTDMGYILRDRMDRLDEIVSILPYMCNQGSTSTAAYLKSRMDPIQKTLDKILNY